MRKLIRSISPFSKKNVTIEDPGPSVPLNPSNSTINTPNSSSSTIATPKPTWSVEGINFLQFLQIFYEKYNPEKLSSIDFIYQEYKGEEMVLIYELAEKYHLSHDEMQKLLNLSKNSSSTLKIETTSAMIKNGPSTYSTSNGSVNSEPQELHSVVAPNWQQSKRPERTNHRNVSPYIARPETNPLENKLTDKPNESQRTPPSISLQDIIQTTRQHDLLAKKSVRFSVTEPETDDQVSENNSSQSGIPSIGTRKIMNGIPPSNSSVNQLSPSPSSLQNTFPTVNQTLNVRTNQGYPTLQTQSGSSSLQARIRSSLNQTTKDGESTPASSTPTSTSVPTNQSGKYTNPLQNIPSQRTETIQNFNSMTSIDSFGSTISAKVVGRLESPEKSSIDATRIKVLEEELDNFKSRLKEVENERDNLLKMFEDSWNSPSQVLKIVRTYLAKYNREVEEIVEDEQNSVRSSLSENYPSKLTDLEGTRSYKVTAVAFSSFF